jgi:hypothetical protein
MDAFRRVRAAWLFVAGLTLASGVVHCSSSSYGEASDAADGGTKSDTSSPSDAGGTIDLMPGSDGATSGSLCSSPHALCDDFNRDGSPFDSMRWGAELGVGGVLATPSYATSPALVVTTTAPSGYRLQKTIPGPIQSVHCAFLLYIEDTGNNSFGVPLNIALTGAVNEVTYFSLRPKVDSRPAALVENVSGRPDRAVEFFAVGPGTWNRIELELPVERLWLNGVEKVVEPPDGGSAMGPFASMSIELGLSLSVPESVAWRTALDDVVCDVRR